MNTVSVAVSWPAAADPNTAKLTVAVLAPDGATVLQSYDALPSVTSHTFTGVADDANAGYTARLTSFSADGTACKTPLVSAPFAPHYLAPPVVPADPQGPLAVAVGPDLPAPARGA